MYNNDMIIPPRDTSGIGYMIIRTSTAMGAIPVKDAIINISNADQNNNDIIMSLRSNSDGTTNKIPLSAPPKQLSYSPNRIPPYSLYNLEVFADGYYSKNYVNIPIFDGITSYQSVELIPLSANQYTDNFTINAPTVNESFPPNL